MLGRKRKIYCCLWGIIFVSLVVLHVACGKGRNEEEPLSGPGLYKNEKPLEERTEKELETLLNECKRKFEYLSRENIYNKELDTKIVRIQNILDERRVPVDKKVFLAWKTKEAVENEPEAVEYFLNDNSMGNGKEGFKSVLERLAKYDKGILLTIVSEPDSKGNEPFMKIEGMAQRFQSVLGNRKILLKHSYGDRENGDSGRGGGTEPRDRGTYLRN